MDAATADALTAAARQIHASAGSHKRSAEAHRKQARELMARYDELRRLCQQHGIVLHIQESEGERSHGTHERVTRSINDR